MERQFNPEYHADEDRPSYDELSGTEPLRKPPQIRGGWAMSAAYAAAVAARPEDHGDLFAF